MISRTIQMKNAREVLRLAGMEKSIRQIAKLCGISRTAVKNTISQVRKKGLSIESLISLNDIDLKNLIYPNTDIKDSRYIELMKILPNILTALGKKHETLQHQWEKYITATPDGYSYSQFCHYILLVQKADIKTCAVFNYKYGDIMFIDYAGDVVSYTGLDGVEVPVKVFVAILPASQFIYAGLSFTEKTEDWIEQSTRALEYIGGVPDAIIPDCATSVVKKANKFESQLVNQYQKFAEHYKTTVVPARPYSPRDKALVEGVINNIYRYIYPRLRAKNSMSFEELNKNFAELLDVFNNRIMRRFNESRIDLFNNNEKEKLRELPSDRYIFHKYQAPRKIGATSHIFLKEDQHYYSIPHRYAGQKCDIYYTSSIIKIFCNNERLCVHSRQKGIGQYTTDPNHLSSRLKDFMLWDPQKAKDKAKSFDPAVAELIDNIFSAQAHHLQARKSIYGVFDLASKYKKERFEAACKIAIREGATRYLFIKNILEKNLDKKETEQTAFEYTEVNHKNLRYTKQDKNNDRTNNDQNEVA